MASVSVYGGLVHADNEVNLVTMDYRTQYSPRNKKLIETRTVNLRGEFIYTDTQSIVNKINAAITAYSNDYQDFTYTVGGVLAHQLRNDASCISGVKVVSKNFPSGSPEQLATTRTFGVTLQAKYDVSEDNIVSWTESLSVTGTGGPVKTVVNTIFGPFQFYYAPASAVYVRQSGSSVGFNSYPAAPAPIGNQDAEFLDRHNITQTSGTQQGTGIRYFRTSWSYQFAFAFLNGFLPTSK